MAVLAAQPVSVTLPVATWMFIIGWISAHSSHGSYPQDVVALMEAISKQIKNEDER